MTAEIEASVRAAITEYHQALIKVLKPKDPPIVEDLSAIGEKAANLLWNYQRFIAATQGTAINSAILAFPPKNPPGKT
jgi:hypothetical protein